MFKAHVAPNGHYLGAWGCVWRGDRFEGGQANVMPPGGHQKEPSEGKLNPIETHTCMGTSYTGTEPLKAEDRRAARRRGREGG